mmetsp:Transcript_2577/g.7016  ORF Transcript_2577/g.7016 Transcript_2577/m.7016 type:complete len:355 (-) Transcript_2577:191-1255(-)
MNRYGHPKAEPIHHSSAGVASRATKDQGLLFRSSLYPRLDASSSSLPTVIESRRAVARDDIRSKSRHSGSRLLGKGSFPKHEDSNHLDHHHHHHRHNHQHDQRSFNDGLDVSQHDGVFAAFQEQQEAIYKQIKDAQHGQQDGNENQRRSERHAAAGQQRSERQYEIDCGQYDVLAAAAAATASAPAAQSSISTSKATTGFPHGGQGTSQAASAECPSNRSLSTLSSSTQNSSSTTQSTGTTTTTTYMPDRAYSSTHRLRIQGMDAAYQAIADGTATLVSCANCRAFLQVSKGTRLVYCVGCHELTRLGDDDDGDDAAHRSDREDVRADTSNDEIVARALQRQEDDVNGVARKTA